MALTVKELKEKLEDVPDDYEVKVDPPYSPVFGVYVRDGEEVVEIHH